MESDSSQYQTGMLFAERYQIEAALGSGGMGDVYLVHDSLLNEKVALKILHPQHSKDETQAKRFIREVQVARKVNHPNVVKTHDCGTYQGRLYFTMEYIRGVSLKDQFAAGGIPFADIPQLFADIAAGIHAIHEIGVIHRDLKPENIILLEGGGVKIADFGVVRPVWSDLTSDQDVVGSAPYMAPEQWTGSDLSTATDLYAFGIMLYQAYSGVNPFAGRFAPEMMSKHLQHQPKALNEIDPSIPVWLTRLVQKLLIKDPKARYADAAEVVQIIQRGLVGESTPHELALPVDALAAIPSSIDVGSEAYPSQALRPLSDLTRFDTAAYELAQIEAERPTVKLSRASKVIAGSGVWRVLQTVGAMAIFYMLFFKGSDTLNQIFVFTSTENLLLRLLAKFVWLGLTAAAPLLVVAATRSALFHALAMWLKGAAIWFFISLITFSYVYVHEGYSAKIFATAIQQRVGDKIFASIVPNIIDLTLFLPEDTKTKMVVSAGKLMPEISHRTNWASKVIFGVFWLITLVLVARTLAGNVFQIPNRQFSFIFTGLPIVALAPVVLLYLSSYFLGVATPSELKYLSHVTLNLVGLKYSVNLIALLSGAITWGIIYWSLLRSEQSLQRVNEDLLRRSGVQRQRPLSGSLNRQI